MVSATQAAAYEAKYRELTDAAHSVVREARRLLASPDARALESHGQPWLPVWHLRDALERFAAAQQALLPTPDEMDASRRELAKRAKGR